MSNFQGDPGCSSNSEKYKLQNFMFDPIETEDFESAHEDFYPRRLAENDELCR